MATNVFPPESLSAEIDRIVAERRALRDAGAPESELEANRRQLMDAQARLTRILIERHSRQRS